MEGYEAVDRAVTDVRGWEPSCCEWVVIGGGGVRPQAESLLNLQDFQLSYFIILLPEFDNLGY